VTGLHRVREIDLLSVFRSVRKSPLIFSDLASGTRKSWQLRRQGDVSCVSRCDFLTNPQISLICADWFAGEEALKSFMRPMIYCGTKR